MWSLPYRAAVKRSRWLVTGLVVVAVGALVATVLLQGGDDGPDASALLAATPAKVEQAGSAHVTIAVALDSTALDVEVKGSGAVDFAKRAGWLTFDVLGRRTELRTDGDTVFVRPNGDQTWLAVQADEAGPLASIVPVPTDLVALIERLRDVGTRIDDLGHERAGRHLRAQIDVGEAEILGLAGKGKSLPLEVWIDDAGLPTRLRARGTREGIGVVVTVELSDYGAALGVAIPPEGAVRDVEGEELAQLVGGD